MMDGKQNRKCQISTEQVRLTDQNSIATKQNHFTLKITCMNSLELMSKASERQHMTWNP